MKRREKECRERRGGSVVLSEPDWGGCLLDLPVQEVTARFLYWRSQNSVRNSWIGRQLPRLMRDAGLDNISITPDVAVFTDFEVADTGGIFTSSVNRAVKDSALTQDEADRLLAECRQMSQHGEFLTTIPSFIVSGKKT